MIIKESLIVAISLWTFFGLQHSLLARPFFKKIIEKVFGVTFEKYFYRFFYFISQCVIFVVIYKTIKNLDYGNIIFKLDEKYLSTVYFLNIFSNIFLILTVLHFNVGKFTGFSQIFDFIFKIELKKEDESLNKMYLYKFIRHPMYLGIILVYTTSTTIYTELFFTNLACIIIYIEIGSYFEEKSLIKVFKKDYEIYQKKTYKYFPFIR